MLVTFIHVVHVLVCVFLILVILLQAGKDAGMGAAFGGGGSGSVFGGRGAGSFLGKVTAVCAGIFFLTSLSLSFAASFKHPSLVGLIKKQEAAKSAQPPASNAAPAGSAPAGSAPAGSAPAGSAPAGSAPAGSAPASSAPASSAPAGNAAPPATAK